MSSKRVREFRGCTCHTSNCIGHDISYVEKSFSGSEHSVAASSLSSDHLSCTIFFSPSRQICKDEKTRTTLSRRLTKLLRHDAARRGLPIGSDGYVCIGNILALPEYRQLSMSDVLYIVKCDEKKRYSVRVDDSVASYTQKEVLNRRGNVTNDFTNLLAEKVKPLPEVDCRPVAENSPSSGRFLLSNVVRKDKLHLKVATNNPLRKKPFLETVYVEYRRKLRDNPGDEEGPDTAVVFHRQGGCVCAPADTRCVPGPAQSTEPNSAFLRSDDFETESADYSVNRVTATRGKWARADVEIQVTNFSSEQKAVCLGLCGERSFYSGYVVASQVSIRAVQGHSLSSVDSDKLLRRVSTLAELVDSVTVPTSRETALTAPSSTRYGSCSGSTHQRTAISSLAGAADPAEAAVFASRGGICVVHGTYWRRWKSIQKTGLCRMSRNHIHFTSRLPGEGEVISGMRPNAEIFIFLDVERVLAAGVPLYVAENGVVLSPGNEKGVIECKFFKKVVERKTGKCLVFNGDENREEKYAAADEAKPT